MDEKLRVIIRGYEHLTAEEKHRARRADAIYEAAFGEVNLKLDAFLRSPAWVEFVEGEIDEGELWGRAMDEREQFGCLPRKAA